MKEKNYTQRAIEYAIAGGWEPDYLPAEFYQNKSMEEWKHYAVNHENPKVFFHDPKFWQSMERGLKSALNMDAVTSVLKPKHYWTKKNHQEVSILDWASNTAHSMWDHLFDGKELDSFFQEVIEGYKM